MTDVFSTRKEALAHPAPIGRPAPFRVGQRIRYMGQRHHWSEQNGQRIDTLFHGMEVVIEAVRAPYRASLVHSEDEDGGGDEWWWSVAHGGSCYTAPGGMKCSLDVEICKDWVVVE